MATLLQTLMILENHTQLENYSEIFFSLIIKYYYRKMSLFMYKISFFRSGESKAFNTTCWHDKCQDRF